MSHRIDELSKSLADESISRRQSFRRFGAALAGALLGPLGLQTARAGPRDPCKAFCRCHNRQQQDACLAACHDCGGDTNRLCGNCGSIVCCAQPGPYEQGACVDGQCTYWCVNGAADCGDYCADLANDLDNCGACGHECDDPGTTGYAVCVSGTCQYFYCSPYTDYLWDASNCGRCGNQCPLGFACAFGICGSIGGGDG